MGKIFTWDEIRAGKIPTYESFNLVASTIRDSFLIEQSIVTALLFGSVVRGDSNQRSDIDCLVLYKTEHERLAIEAMHRVDRIAHSLHVPINFTPCDTILGKTRLHHVGSSFIRHLQASIDAGGIIKGTIDEHLAATISVDQEIESYIKMKMYSMQESFAQMTSFSDEKMAAFLKKAMESMTHVARKMLIYEGLLEGDSKRQVQVSYRKAMPVELSSLFDSLLESDAWYSSELEEQIRNPNEERYTVTLSTLQIKVPEVLEFLRRNILRLDKNV